MLTQLIFTRLVGEIDYGAMGDFDAAGYATGARVWNTHDGDWIYQGGPVGAPLKGPEAYTYNQWGNLNTDPVDWHISGEVDPCGVDKWMYDIGGGIY